VQLQSCRKPIFFLTCLSGALARDIPAAGVAGWASAQSKDLPVLASFNESAVPVSA
jgi:hypothetical protein